MATLAYDKATNRERWRKSGKKYPFPQVVTFLSTSPNFAEAYENDIIPAIGFETFGFLTNGAPILTQITVAKISFSDCKWQCLKWMEAEVSGDRIYPRGWYIVERRSQ